MYIPLDPRPPLRMRGLGAKFPFTCTVAVLFSLNWSENQIIVIITTLRSPWPSTLAYCSGTNKRLVAFFSICCKNNHFSTFCAFKVLPINEILPLEYQPIYQRQIKMPFCNFSSLTKSRLKMYIIFTFCRPSGGVLMVRGRIERYFHTNLQFIILYVSQWKCMVVRNVPTSGLIDFKKYNIFSDQWTELSQYTRRHKYLQRVFLILRHIVTERRV